MATLSAVQEAQGNCFSSEVRINFCRNKEDMEVSHFNEELWKW